MKGIPIIHILLALSMFAVVLFVLVCYILTLQKALLRCAPGSRTIKPWLMWLLLVPFVNLFVNFPIVLGLAKTLGNEFARRGLPLNDPTPARDIGITQAVLLCLCIVPFLAPLAFLIHVVVWSIYWNKIASYSRTLAQLPAAPTASVPL